MWCADGNKEEWIIYCGSGAWQMNKLKTATPSEALGIYHSHLFISMKSLIWHKLTLNKNELIENVHIWLINMLKSHGLSCSSDTILWSSITHCTWVWDHPFMSPHVFMHLCLSTPPTYVDECGFFNSLVVRLPFSLIFWLFWVIAVFYFSCNFCCGCVRRWIIFTYASILTGSWIFFKTAADL